MSSQKPLDKPPTFRHRLQEIELQPATSTRKIDVRLLVDGKEAHKLPPIEKGQVLRWKDLSLPCDVRANSEIALQITEKHHMTRDRVGEAKYLVASAANKRDMSIECDNNIFTAKLTFLDQETAKHAYSDALAKVERMESRSSVIEKTGKAGRAFKTILTFGSTMVDLDPTGGAKVAFAACSKAWEHLENQEKYDTTLSNLIEGLASIVPSVKSIEEIADASIGKTITALIYLIEDVSLFVLNYKSRSVWGQTLRSLVDASAQEQIDIFVGKFRKLEEELDRGVNVKTFETVQNDSTRTKLKELNPAGLASYDPTRACIEGTRVKIIGEIMSSIQQPDTDQRLLWVYGLAGLGKSSIAASVCRGLDNAHTLAASFFCKRDKPELRDPHRVLITIIYSLAVRWKLYEEAVVAVIRADLELHTRHIQPLYEALVSRPLRSLGKARPASTLTVVVDALDECGDSDTRKQLLVCLRDMSQLVPWLKVVVTSRPIPDIQEFFGQTRTDRLASYNVLSYDALDDIRIFIRNSLIDVAQADQWPQNAVDMLSERSSGLFIWARTACKFISDGHDPCKRLEQVLAGTPRLADPSGELDALYTTAIKVSAEDGDEDNLQAVLECLRAVVVTAANTPLSVSSLGKLLHERVSAYTLGRVLRSLASVLYLDQTQDGVVRISHPSFMDYITDPLRSKELCVDLEKENTTLAQWCLDVMMKELKFNICGLETSHLLNRSVSDLNARVQAAIGPHLDYSCLYWSSHLSRARVETLKDTLGRFLFGRKLLYWIEALSLLGKLNMALSSLLELVLCASDIMKEVSLYANDAYRFVLGFYDAIAESTPHLYVSALAFAPERSGIGQRMRPLFTNLLAIPEGADEGWSQCLRSISVSSGVLSIAISPNGRLIVSGCNDHTVRVWDAQTGDVVLEPLRGHSGAVRSVALSQDGHRVVSGSEDKTVRIWDVQTGDEVLKPLRGHTGAVRSVALSQDGRRIASGSADKTVRIWNVETGDAALEPLRGHSGYVVSVGFSPDGYRVISGSDDHTVRIWDSITGDAALEPLQGHSDSVRSVSFSQDGRRIVSGSSDKTVRIWDAETGDTKLEPLRGHSSWVYSAAFSPDSRHIVSGSLDTTVRIWDAQTGDPVLEPLRGHSGYVVSVAFSSDGRRIVSGSADKTVRIWDAETSNTALKLLPGHSGSVQSVAFSPDSCHIVSGSNDKTVRIWDTQTGEPIFEPLRGHLDVVRSVAFSQDGRRIVSGSDDKTVRIWDAQTGDEVFRPLQGHSGAVRSVAFSQDGRRIASGSSDKTVRIWDAQTGNEVVKPLRGHSDAIRSIAFSWDGHRIVSGSRDNTVRIWDVETGNAALKPLQGHSGSVQSVAFSQDGHRIVSGSKDKTLRIWDAKTGDALLHPLHDYSGWVYSVAFSPDSRRIVSGCWDNTVRIWDAETGNLVHEPLRGHSAAVLSVAFSRDGCRIVSGSFDSAVRIWDAKTGDAIPEPLQYILPGTGLQILTTHHGSKLVSTTSQLVRYMNSKGWVCTTEGNLLLWVPSDNRQRDESLVCISELSPRRQLFDFSMFAHGVSWSSIANI